MLAEKRGLLTILMLTGLFTITFSFQMVINDSSLFNAILVTVEFAFVRTFFYTYKGLVRDSFITNKYSQLFSIFMIIFRRQFQWHSTWSTQLAAVSETTWSTQFTVTSFWAMMVNSLETRTGKQVSHKNYKPKFKFTISGFLVGSLVFCNKHYIPFLPLFLLVTKTRSPKSGRRKSWSAIDWNEERRKRK